MASGRIGHGGGENGLSFLHHAFTLFSSRTASQTQTCDQSTSIVFASWHLWSLLHANRATLNMDEVREYFRLFKKEALLDELLG